MWDCCYWVRNLGHSALLSVPCGFICNFYWICAGYFLFQGIFVLYFVYIPTEGLNLNYTTLLHQPLCIFIWLGEFLVELYHYVYSLFVLWSEIDSVVQYFIVRYVEGMGLYSYFIC